MPSLPSIQSFFKREGLQNREATTSTHSFDGFTEEEIAASTSPIARKWEPPGEYLDVSIANILPGKGNVRFSGRVAHFRAAQLDEGRYSKPWHYVVVKDDTGAIAIKLVPIGIPVSMFTLGQLVTVWATYVGEPPTLQNSVPYVSRCTPINPERGTNQFIEFKKDTADTEKLYRSPLEYDSDPFEPTPLPGLMTLGSYLKTGHDDVRGVRILVCVGSISARKRIQKKGRDTELEFVEVGICDNTAQCVLTLWEDKADSARLWKPNETILLITSPKWQQAWRKGDKASQPNPAAGLGVDYATLVEVDPEFPDADWLRKWAKERIRKGKVCVPFPEGVWDADEAVNGPVRVLFTLAEVDESARREPDAGFTGKLNITVLDMGLLTMWQRRMLCCGDCCGVPLFANSPVATCKNCLSQRELSLNPRIVGTLADETGCIEKGKLVWSLRAWQDLFRGGRTSGAKSEETAAASPYISTTTRGIWKDLTAEGAQSLREMEDRVLYSRITLTFGWSPAVERLCVLGVEW